MLPPCLRLSRSTAFGSSTERLKFAVMNAYLPSREIIRGDPPANGVTTRATSRSALMTAATFAT